VPVRDNDGDQLIAVVTQVREVGYGEVDTSRHPFVGKEDAGVYDDYLAVVFDGHHITADVAKPAEGHDFQGSDGQRLIEQTELLGLVGHFGWTRFLYRGILNQGRESAEVVLYC
jgi:hypothetical protein